MSIAARVVGSCAVAEMVRTYGGRAAAQHPDKIKRLAWIGDRLLWAAVAIEMHPMIDRCPTARMLANLGGDTTSNAMLANYWPPLTGDLAPRRICGTIANVEWRAATAVEACICLLWEDKGMSGLVPVARALLAARLDCA